MLGTIRWFNNQKGFGFVSDPEGRDIFIHYSEVKGKGYKMLNPGDKVEFDLGKTEKGVCAKNVDVVWRAPRE